MCRVCKASIRPAGRGEAVAAAVEGVTAAGVMAAGVMAAAEEGRGKREEGRGKREAGSNRLW